MSSHRDWMGDSDEHKPVFWWNGHPIYSAYLIAIVLVASMVATSLLLWGSGSALIDALVFDTGAIYRGQAWRVATYGLVNRPDWNFAFDMLVLVWFGREVERFSGRKSFLVLFAACYLVTPVLFTLIGQWMPVAFAGKIGVLGIFIAFAMIQPGAPVFFGVPAKWAALIVLGLSTMIALSEHDRVSLVGTWASSVVAYAMMRHHRGEWSLPSIRLPQQRPPARPVPEPPKRSGPDNADVDAILDKIATSGLHSLTPKERARLEAAGRKKR